MVDCTITNKQTQIYKNHGLKYAFTSTFKSPLDIRTYKQGVFKPIDSRQ